MGRRKQYDISQKNFLQEVEQVIEPGGTGTEILDALTESSSSLLALFPLQSCVSGLLAVSPSSVLRDGSVKKGVFSKAFDPNTDQQGRFSSHAEFYPVTLEIQRCLMQWRLFLSAFALGRHGGVQELMGSMESANLLYSKAVRLLVFLLLEAPSLFMLFCELIGLFVVSSVMGRQNFGKRTFALCFKGRVGILSTAVAIKKLDKEDKESLHRHFVEN